MSKCYCIECQPYEPEQPEFEETETKWADGHPKCQWCIDNKSNHCHRTCDEHGV